VRYNAASQLSRLFRAYGEHVAIFREFNTAVLRENSDEITSMSPRVRSLYFVSQVAALCRVVASSDAVRHDAVCGIVKMYHGVGLSASREERLFFKSVVHSIISSLDFTQLASASMGKTSPASLLSEILPHVILSGGYVLESFPIDLFIENCDVKGFAAQTVHIWISLYLASEPIQMDDIEKLSSLLEVRSRDLVLSQLTWLMVFTRHY
jgi:hypothetical protein